MMQMAKSRGSAEYHLQPRAPDLEFLYDVFEAHTIVGDSDPIPGLRKPDEEDVEFPLSELPTPLPMKKTTTYTIRDISIFAMPSIERFEREMLQRLEQDFRVHVCTHASALNPGTLRISERRLKVSVHNGSRCTQEPIFFNLSRADFDLQNTAAHNATKKHGKKQTSPQARGKCLQFKGSFDIENVPIHKQYAIIFQLEYRLTTTFIAHTAHGEQPMDMDNVVVVR